jgi:hypothetical protein
MRDHEMKIGLCRCDRDVELLEFGRGAALKSDGIRPLTTI